MSALLHNLPRSTRVFGVPQTRRLGTARCSRTTPRRGAIFIIALAVTVILSALLLMFVQQMRVEAATSGNRLSAAQADAVEQGAEQWVLAQVEANTSPLPASSGGSNNNGGSAAGSTSTTGVDVTTIPAEALQVGGGFFWVLHPDPLQDQTYAFGIVDEAAKLNLNGVTAEQLMVLPNMTQDAANAIATWPTSVGDSGTVPYETVENLLLAETQNPPQLPKILYGYDLNRDGVIEETERVLANGAASTNGTTSDSRGIFNYVTVYSTTAQPTTTSTGGTTPGRGNGPAPKTVGLINVNTAPAQVLACLPGLTQADAATLISARASSTTVGSTTWVSTALGQAKAQTIARDITGVSYQYSADIVAVSGDGRAFKRVRVVVDARQQPAKIVYRKDITSLGWPLTNEVRTSLRAGKGVPGTFSGTSNQQTGGGLIH